MVNGGLARASLEAGTVVGGYVVEALLGKGGMGEVWRAYDGALRRPVALKVLSAEAHADPSIRARFVREGRAAAALVHRSIVTVYGAGEDGGRTFLAMELVRGTTFRLASPSVLATQRLVWLLDIARALGAVHAAGFVHRDVKPDNIMVTPEGVAKLLDFGIARAQGPEGAGPASFVRTGTGQVLGTPRYIAPEQWRGGTVDGRADQFAWGLVAYEALSGRHPDDVSAGFGRMADWRGPAAPLQTLAPDLPFGVAAIVGRALATFPEQRFASMFDLARELEVALGQHTPMRFEPAPTWGSTTSSTSLGGHAPPGPPPDTTKKAAVFLLAFLAVPFVALAGVGIVYMQSQLTATPPPPVTTATQGAATQPEPVETGATPTMPMPTPAMEIDAGRAVAPPTAAPKPAPAAPTPSPSASSAVAATGCARVTSTALVLRSTSEEFPKPVLDAWMRALEKPLARCVQAAPERFCRTSSLAISGEMELQKGQVVGYVFGVSPTTGRLSTHSPLDMCVAGALPTKAPAPKASPRFQFSLEATLAP